MWREYIKSISDDYEFTDPAAEQAITKAQNTLGLALPTDLCELLKETNGLHQRSTYLLFILSVERIEKDNLDMRRTQAFDFYMPFDNLLFFADAGNGDKFGFPISQDGKIRQDVFVWNHEDDSRCMCAPSLRVFIQWWHEQKIRW
jgi:hypothetical protein